MAKEYTSDNIKVLSSIEHIRMRKGLYIGEAENPHHLLSEIMDNANDELGAGFSDETLVEVDTVNNIYTITDHGRGVPHGKKKLENGEEKEVLEVLLTVSNSGGKFNNDSYKYSSGLNGLGLTITNALSNFIEITSRRNGKFVRAVAHGDTNVKIERGKTADCDGTTVKFQPNPIHFRAPKIPTDFILSRCRIATALGFKTRLIIDGIERDTVNSIFDLVKEEDEKIVSYIDVPTIEVSNEQEELMKVAIRYTSDTKDRYFGYTNLLPNYLGGTHVQCLSKTIISVWEALIAKYKNLRPTVDLKPSDYLVGLRGICAVFISKPEFSSQTKEKLVVNKAYFDSLMEAFSKSLTKYLVNNIEVAQQLLKRFEEYRIAQNALLSRKEISSLIKINEDSGDNIRRRSVVSKLVECTSKKRDGTELFIVEGNSALGPYLYVRDQETQAVLPLRGKILNTTGKDLKDAIQNKEICDIANSIGCGIGAQCDASKSRYEKIIISSDADEDGKQIACLVIALFVNLFPDIIKQGRLFVSVPPLFCWGDRPSNYGSCNKLEDIPPEVKHFHRMKGLGEMQNEQVEYYLVNKKTRHLLQIEFPSDVDEFNKIMGTSEGKGSLLKDLGIVLNNEVRVFSNPEPIKATKVQRIAVDRTDSHTPKITKQPKTEVKKRQPVKQKQEIESCSINLFAGLFD